MDYAWKPTGEDKMYFSVNDCSTGTAKYTATRCDLVFGSNA